MCGKRVTDRQVRWYMDSRKDGRSQAAAAARAGFSERTGRRIDDLGYVRKDQAETNVLFELIAEGVSGISCVVG